MVPRSSTGTSPSSPNDTRCPGPCRFVWHSGGARRSVSTASDCPSIPDGPRASVRAPADHALVWHCVSIAALVHHIEQQVANVDVLPTAGSAPGTNTWDLIVLSRLTPPTSIGGHERLPSLPDLLRRDLPTPADVFCAGSTAIHAQLRIPTINVDDLIALGGWLTAQNADTPMLDACPSDISWLRAVRKRPRSLCG